MEKSTSTRSSGNIDTGSGLGARAAGEEAPTYLDDIRGGELEPSWRTRGSNFH